MSASPIQSILVAGDGIVGLSAALAFARAFPQIRITVLGLPADPAAVADHFATTLPSIGRFHAAIGFDELDLVQRSVASHHLGTMFSDDARKWFRTFGQVGRGEGAVPFRQIWLAAKGNGKALAFDRYSPASVIGETGKFVHPSSSAKSPLASYLYGLRLNADRYREALTEAVSSLARVDGKIAAIDRREDGGVAAIGLTDGRRLETDLFVDCSGPQALLLGAISDAFDDWAEWLPARHLAHRSEASEVLDPLDRVERVPDGWRLTATLPGATSQAMVTVSAAPGSVALQPGRRRASFVKNVLAIGDASVALDPLQGANLSLAHSAILRAIALFPGRDCHPLALAEYNRLTALELDRARDFHALFQSRLADVAALPDSLERTLTQWRARGRLPFFEEEIFTESDWEQALVGADVLPDAPSPLAAGIDRTAAAAAMAAYASELTALAARLPSYPDYLARVAQAPRRAK